MAEYTKPPTYDYLKYYRVIRYYMKIKYNLSSTDLDMLLFLYSERYFSRQKFKEFDELLRWDVKRFQRLVSEGWIDVFRAHYQNVHAIYQLSIKGKRMIISIYKKLNGEEIPVSQSNNKMFAKNVKYTDKVYRNMIKEMNAFTKQQRHQPPESR